MNIAIFASGNGSNAEQLIRYFNYELPGNARGAGDDIRVELVVCNRKEAGVYERAERLGVAAKHVTKTDFNDEDYMNDLLGRHGIEFVVLAGFLLMIPDYLLRRYPDRIINIHPSLLPKYGGKGMYGNKVHEAVVTSGDRETGITIHMVSEECDGGEIVFQATTAVEAGDTASDVAGKVHALEYKYYPEVVERVIRSM